MFRKATLRTMPPVTRSFAILLNELESVLRREKNLVVKMTSLEIATQKRGKVIEMLFKDGAAYTPLALA